MSKIKLLLVDDEEDYVRTLAERMEMRDVGSRVALSGEEALQMVEEDAPDVMILDLRMPGIDGMEVLERVKSTHPQVQVVILTGHGSEGEEEEARSLGAFEYLRKPADTSRLLRTVRAAWKAAISLLEDSGQELSRGMTAAAFAEAGAPELAEEMLSRADSGAGRAPAETLPGEGGAASGTLKVLLVDDEEDFVTTVADRMAMRELGSEIALSGEAALTILEQDVPDVVVLDLRMPGMSGMEVLRKLKASHPQVEVIIMTGHGSEEDEQEALRLGAFAYLQKPVEIDQLVRRVRQAGRRRQGGG